MPRATPWSRGDDELEEIGADGLCGGRRQVAWPQREIQGAVPSVGRRGAGASDARSSGRPPLVVARVEDTLPQRLAVVHDPYVAVGDEKHDRLAPVPCAEADMVRPRGLVGVSTREHNADAHRGTQSAKGAV